MLSAIDNEDREGLKRVIEKGTMPETSLELLYGKRGVPADDPFELRQPLPAVPACLALPSPPVKQEVLDALDKKLGLVKDEKKEFPVTIHRDTSLEFPELYLHIYVTGPPEDSYGFPELLASGRCYKAKSLETADVVIFTGGPDVDPALYGEAPHIKTFIDPDRDKEDLNIYMKCLERGIPMIGICRGAQFLQVMNNGKLFQHVDNHVGDHSIWDVREKRLIDRASSVHHQACIANNRMDILATVPKSLNRWRNNIDHDVGKIADIEAFFYRDTCCLGVQGHPEYRGYHQFAKWFLEQVEYFVVVNPDVIWHGEGKGKVRRLDPTILEKRKSKMIATLPSN